MSTITRLIRNHALIRSLIVALATVTFTAPALAGVMRASSNNGGPTPLAAAPTLPALDVNEYINTTYSGIATGRGSFEALVVMTDDEWDIAISDLPNSGTGCEIMVTLHDGMLSQWASEQCDIEHLFRVIPVVFPDTYDQALIDQFWASWGGTSGGSGNGSDDPDDTTPPDSGIDPGWGRQDGGDDDCVAAKGECMMALVTMVGAGVAVGSVATPFAGLLVGGFGVAGALLFCAGKINGACGEEDYSQFIEELLGDWYMQFVDVEDFVDVEEFIQEIMNLYGDVTIEVMSNPEAYFADPTDGIYLPYIGESLAPQLAGQ